MERDILQEIPNEELLLLRDLYGNYKAEAPHIVTLIDTCIIWRKKLPSKYIRVMGVENDWLRSGTFVVLIQHSLKHLFIFTLEEDCRTLHIALTQTRSIDWKDNVLWFAVSSRHCPVIENVMKRLGLVHHNYEETGLWVIAKEKALQFNVRCPDDVYIDRLDTSHANIVNNSWPHRFDGSDKYISILIEINDSYGVFLKSNDTLVSWILLTDIGQLGNLQTLPEHGRKGYASLLTKLMSKKIARKGHNPAATILVWNAASIKLFSRLGFQYIDTCNYYFTP